VHLVGFNYKNISPCTVLWMSNVSEPRFLQKAMNQVHPRTTERIECCLGREWLLSPSGNSRTLIWIEGFCSVQTNPSIIAIFFHLHLLHDSSQSFETYFNIVLPSTFKSNESFVVLGFSNIFCMYFKSLLSVRHGNLDRPPWLITFINLRLFGTYSK
jgi:hypothetical protein